MFTYCSGNTQGIACEEVIDVDDYNTSDDPHTDGMQCILFFTSVNCFSIIIMTTFSYSYSYGITSFSSF